MMGTIKERLWISATVCFWFLITACPSPAPEPRYKIQPGLKDYFDYQKGSFWVYRDAVTGILDTIEVTGKFLDESSSYDTYTIGTTQKSNGYWRPISVQPNLVTYSIINKSSLEELYYHITQGFPFTTGHTSINIPYGTHLTRRYDTYNVGSNTYKDVYEISVKDSLFNINDTLYINYDQGFIRLKEHNPLQSHDWILHDLSVKR